jgi:hypothetical protein
MPNYDGLWEVVVIYDVTISARAFEHRHTFDVLPIGDFAPGTAPEDIEITMKNGLDTPLLDFTEDYLPLMWKLLGTGTSQPRMELWKYDPEPSYNKTFITAWTSSNTFPLAAGAAQAAHQNTYTFRTIGGGVARLQLMEDAGTGTARIAFNALAGDSAAFADFACGATSAIVGRDNLHLLTGIAGNQTQNEKLARKRFRTS